MIDGFILEKRITAPYKYLSLILSICYYRLMQVYFNLFQIFLAFYCLSSLALLSSPLRALAYFLFFRATFSIAAYAQTPSIVGLPFFIPALAILTLQTMVAVHFSKVRFRLNHVFGTYLLFLFLAALISMIFVFAGEPLISSAEEISKYMFPMAAYFLVYVGAKDEKDLEKITKYLAIASLIPIMTGVAEFVLGIGLSYNTFTFMEGARPSGTIIDPNLYGIYLSLCLFIALPKFLGANRTKWSFLYVLLILFTIIVARNRGTWISLFVAFAVAVPFFKKHLKLYKWIISAALLIVLALPIMLARFGELNEYDQWGQKQDTAAGRYQYSLLLFNKAMESPLFGGGVGAFDARTYASQNETVMLPHNDYVRSTVQFGFPATFVYILFLFSQFIWAFKHRRDKLWHYQFAAFAGQIYIIIISVAQNILTDMTSYSLIFSLLALSHRASALSANSSPQTRKNLLPKRNATT